MNEPNLVVSYDGEGCVYNYQETVTVETIEYVTIDGTSTDEISAIVDVIPY